MCKIAVIPKVTKQTSKLAWRFSRELAKDLTKNDNDGFGYLGLNKDGLVAERWLDPKQAFQTREPMPEDLRSTLDALPDSLIESDDYSSAGTLSKDVSCLVLHARMATSGYGILNTHPFVSAQTGLVHNGVIPSPLPSEMPTSTCDSEVILTKYLRHDVTHDASKIQGVSDELAGYFACAVISKTNTGLWLLDVFRDAQAKLAAVYVPKLKTIVFCTDPKMIKSACKRLKWKTGKTFQVEDCQLMRFNAKTGDVISETSFTREVPTPATIDARYPSEPTGYLDTNDDYSDRWGRLDTYDSDRTLAVDEYYRKTG